MLSPALAIAIVFALLGLLLWCSKRLQSRGATARTLQLMDSLTIAPGRAVVVVRSGERCFLLGTTAQSVRLIAELASENVRAMKAGR